MAIPGLAGARAAVVFFTLMALTGCGERHEWNQKVTVAVETPSGEVAGSSITHVEARGGGKRSFIHDGPSTGYEVDGEATIVDFGSGRYLFALLQGAGPGFGGRAQNIAGVALCPREMEKATAACFAHVEGLANGSSAAVQVDNYPLLVTFDDISDPKSVKLVDPANLAATFGHGFALKSISVEITDEKVSGGKVENVLAWLCDYKARGARLNGSTSIGISDNELSNRTGTGSFKRGECK